MSIKFEGKLWMQWTINFKNIFLKIQKSEKIWSPFDKKKTVQRKQWGDWISELIKINTKEKWLNLIKSY